MTVETAGVTAARKQPTAIDYGIEGPGSIAVSTIVDPERRAVVEQFLEKARAIRPILRAEQALAEAEKRYSQRVHQYFLENDLYKMLTPKRFGGYELSVSDFYLVVSEIARGCPSTAWCFCLGSAHVLQLSSYWPLGVQEEIYASSDHFIAPISGNQRGVQVTKAEGGYRLTGTWRYASGAPYSTHMIVSVALPDAPNGVNHWVIIPRDSYEVLDDWGGLLGMKGSGSNTVRVLDAFVPDRYAIIDDFQTEIHGPTQGTDAFDNPLYGGPFEAFGVGEVSAITVGLGYAALDEYFRILVSSRPAMVLVSYAESESRLDQENWQRSFGVAMAKIDAAAAISTQTGRLYDSYARRALDGEAPFTAAQTYRLRDANMLVQDMVYEAVSLMLRGAGSSALLDDQRMQRYYRDITTAVTRTNQLDLAAPIAARAVRDEWVPSSPDSHA